MNILLILLGCNISYLLNDRIYTAVKFASNFNETNVNWFLSGGIKNPDVDTITESEKMGSKLEKVYLTGNNKNNNNWSYIYDTVATNTAENFIMVQQFLEDESVQYSEIYVITSKFHYNRAKKIADKLINKNVKWILGNAELIDSTYWENIHIKNVDTDVNKAIDKFRK